MDRTQSLLSARIEPGVQPWPQRLRPAVRSTASSLPKSRDADKASAASLLDREGKTDDLSSNIIKDPVEVFHLNPPPMTVRRIHGSALEFPGP